MNIAKEKVAKEIGKRLKLVRETANLTRKKMHEKHGINTNTLQAWEKGVNFLNEQAAIKLIEVFKKESLDIKIEWLLHGVLPKADAPHNITVVSSISGDLKVLEEINFFLQRNLHSVSTMIVDNSLFPFFCKGDYVAGIKTSNNKKLANLVGDFCIIDRGDDKEVIVKKILQRNEDNNFTIGGINPRAKSNTPDYFISNISHAAKITRHWLIGNRFLK
jgi:transcriptional regulator with XRE-family HTH domain